MLTHVCSLRSSGKYFDFTIACGGDTHHVNDTEGFQAEQQRRRVVHARGLAVVGCERQSACRGHEPHSRTDTPLKCEEIP